MVYVFLADGFEPIEAITPVDMMRRACIDVTTVSIMDSVMVKGGRGITVEADAMFGDVDFSDADMLILPGGQPGTMNLGNFRPLCQLLLDFNDADAPLAAICAAPSILGKLGILKGLTATIFPGCDDGIEGVRFTDALVEHDRNIITAKGPAAAALFGAEIIKTLKGEQMMKAVMSGMQFQV
ncbi:MAG: DJ-1/PfpI family protein [Bacteroidaceae bacterium]|nr:DJ-1/PfpI family protein [Bacteroidaceae bacterium]